MRVAVVWGAALLALTATAPAGAVTPAARQVDQARGTAFVGSVLTKDSSRIRIRSAGGTGFTFSGHSARPMSDWNRRVVFRRPAAQATRNQTSCATWSRESDPQVQEGLAVRIRDGRSGRVRAVTLTKNTLFNVHTVLNVLTWDTARRGDPWKRVGQFDMAAALMGRGQVRPFPWRVCLRAAGRTVSFKVWFPGTTPRPSWTDPTYARSATLPRGFRAAGWPGWYVGHLTRTGFVTYREMTTR